MYRKKVYGQSKIENCPFCEKQATSANSQGIPVCKDHKDSKLPELKCLCGEYLELRSGKWGPFFTCLNCGNINLRKALEVNPSFKENAGTKTSSDTKTKKLESKKIKTIDYPKEITITSDDIGILY